jgi:ribosome-associated translation inhibitor RaiA
MRKRGLSRIIGMMSGVSDEAMRGPIVRTFQPPRLMPIHIRAAQERFGSDASRYVRKKLSTKLSKFGDYIERVSVRVQDVNGPRGGVDQLCRIKVVMRGQPSVIFESRDSSMNAALDVALAGVQRAVSRTAERRRMKSSRSIQ